MGIKLGICGLNEFGRHFTPVFKAHPMVDEVVLSDLRKDALEKSAKDFSIPRTVGSFDELLKTDVDAVALFTQRWAHGPMAVKALRAGKHVYSAVPAASTLEELSELIRAVDETGLVYAMGETSYYRPQTIYCRKRFASGDFGDFVYGEGQYHHDMEHGFYLPYKVTNGDAWKKFASCPPMLYPTHSVSHVLGVTFRKMTEVACFGRKDIHPDGIFKKDVSAWGNEFSDESGLFRTSDGGMARINEFRRSGAGESRMTIIGTIGAYEEQHKTAVWTAWKRLEDNPKNGVFDYDNAQKMRVRVEEDLSAMRRFDMVKDDGIEISEANLGALPREYLGRKHLGACEQHPVERLPKEFVGLHNGHCGSHQFLVVDFLEAIRTGKLAPNNVWFSARLNAPGIVAHESAMRGGELMKIPDFGVPPESAVYMDPLSVLR